MRTTLQLPDPLWREAKARAAQKGITLTALVDNALRLYLKPPADGRRHRVTWHVEHGEALPGVDFDNRAALYDVLGGRGE
ncbi:MAG: hypothetical protein ACRD01_00990 [Terriglobales bacterium]